MAKKSEMRITDVELELLKSTFADREELLKSIRNLFFGLPMSEDEKTEIKRTFSGEQLRKLMRKQFLPEIQADLPIGQCVDLWMTIDLKDKDISQIRQIVEARKELIDMIKVSLELLESVDGTPVNLNGWVNKVWADGLDSSLIARNQFISHIDQQLAVIRTLAGVKTETVEETKKRLLQDSTQ